MITALSAYQALLQTPSPLTSNRKPDSNDSAGSTAVPSPATGGGDSLELSASPDVFSAVDNYFNLGRSGQFDSFHRLSPADKEQFVKIVAALAQSGYVGYEELIVNNRVERHDVVTSLGDERLRNARVYDPPKTSGR